MPGIYKFFTAMVAVIGNVSLISTGEMNPVFSAIGTVLLYGYYRSMKDYPQLSRVAVGALSFTTFMVFLLNFYINRDIFISVAQMTLIFQSIKSFDMKDPWDPLQVFFVSLLQLLMASELTHSIYFGIVFVLFVIFIVISILVGHFVNEGQRRFGQFLKPIITITLLTLILTVIFFVSLPRFHSGIWGQSFTRGIRTTGFSEKVEFGSFGRVKVDDTVVMRMIISPDKGSSYYIRGMTFDYFDGVAWYDTLKHARRTFPEPDDFSRTVSERSKKYEIEIYLEPIDSDVIFTVKRPYRIESEGSFLHMDTAGAFYMKQKVSKRFFYKLYSVDDYYSDNAYLRNYLQMPDGIKGIKGFTEGITAGYETPMQKANAIMSYLLKNYEYRLFTRRPPEGMTQIEDFLFNTKRGYCEHFATAMTLMLRSINIPARLVTGFLSVQKNEMGDYYVVRQSDAHSWVEAFINGKWYPFDPTPPVVAPLKKGIFLLFDMIKMRWSRYVVGFSAHDQARMARYIFYYPGMRMGAHRSFPLWPVPIAVSLLILFIVVNTLRKRFRLYIKYRYKGVSAEYVRFMNMVRRYGGNIKPSSATEDVLSEAIRTGRFDNREVRAFIEAYRFLRFSGRMDRTMLRNFYDISGRLRRKRH